MKNGGTKIFLACFYPHYFTHFLGIAGTVSIFVLLAATFSVAQTGAQAGTHTKKKTMTGAAAKSGAAANLKVVPALPQRLARFRRVQMPFRTAGLSARERQLVGKL